MQKLPRSRTAGVPLDPVRTLLVTVSKPDGEPLCMQRFEQLLADIKAEMPVMATKLKQLVKTPNQ